MMHTHTFAHTGTQTLIECEAALADFLDPARAMAVSGDLPPSLFAELAQIKGQMASVVDQRARDAALMQRGGR